MSGRRVVVIGSSGSGKSYVARRIAAEAGLPHVELDALLWLPGWVKRGTADMKALIADVAKTEAWVVDGNYLSYGVDTLLWPHADVIVWLDFARWRVLVRLLRRTVARRVLRTPLWNGEPERFRVPLVARDSLVRYVWSTHGRRREALAAAIEAAGAPCIRLTRAAEARRFRITAWAPAHTE